MKKIVLMLTCCSLILLTGCSLKSFQGFFEGKLDEVIKKDQLHEQGFVVDTASLYGAFDQAAHHIDLSDKGLITIPDICALIDAKDKDSVRSLDLSDNAIRILNVDLSCLSYLRTLDLSGNKIQAIQTLGELPALRELDMENNELTTTADFPDLPMLERLNLAFNKLQEVKDLDHLKNLIVLEIQNNAIEYIIGVERLDKLKQLKVDYEKIKGGDITPIMDKLEDLEIMDQLGNAIGQELKDELLKNLPFQI